MSGLRNISKDPDWTMHRAIIKLKAHDSSWSRILAQELTKALNALCLDRIETEKFHADRMIEWIKKGGTGAVTSFTSGPQRQIAYAIEELIAEKTGKPVVRP